MKFEHPFLRPAPSKLSQALNRLAEIEASGIFTNFGPKVVEFESRIAQWFSSPGGSCLTVNNATTGLLLAVRYELEKRGHGHSERARYAIMPSFTFAATIQSALWNGLVPLFCDIDPETWTMSGSHLAELLKMYEGQVALVMPYATFGNSLSLELYAGIAASGIGVVIDAAASLGSLDLDGRQFGSGFTSPIVFSLHATKSFSTSEGGLIYCADELAVRQLRCMSNFGFNEAREAVTLGLNGKMAEHNALLSILKLEDFSHVRGHRVELAGLYKRELPDFQFQKNVGSPVFQFLPALLPVDVAHRRSEFIQRLRARGVEVRTYFSPALHEQSYFRDRSPKSELPVTESISSVVVSLPLYETMSVSSLKKITEIARETVQDLRKKS